jgi:hypothetical protein
MKSLRNILPLAGLALAAALLVLGLPAARATTFTVVNDCNVTIYPAIAPADFDNGGWSQAANTTVGPFTVATTFNGRVWARKNCNTASPAQCDTGQCGGGPDYQCAGGTGQGTTSLAEFNLDATGIDYYDVSNVDSFDFGIGLEMSNGQGYEPTCTADPLYQCPTALQKVGPISGVVAYCTNPCSVLKDSSCCNGLSPQACRDSENTWVATAQGYTNDMHNNCGQVYTYPWDDWWGLHTDPTGSNWTITFCPNGTSPEPGPGNDPWPLSPMNIAGSSSSGHVTVTWTASSAATSYNIYRTTNEGASNGSPTDTPLASGITTTAYTDSANLVNGTV